MNQLPQRTGATDLSDAELLLFDFLFRWYVPRRALTSDLYSFHMNCCYSHGLPDRELDDVLESLVARNLVRAKASDGSPELSYTLSSDGGRLWELERRPDWGTYIDARQDCEGIRQSVLALDETIARQYVGGLFASCLLAPSGKLRVKRIRHCSLLPWRIFGCVTVLRIPILHETSLDCPRWDIYEACRNWWCDVGELDTLNKRVR
jgi:hypothetical protein